MRNFFSIFNNSTDFFGLRTQIKAADVNASEVRMKLR